MAVTMKDVGGAATSAELAVLGEAFLEQVDDLVGLLLDPQRRTPGYSNAEADDLRYYVRNGLIMLIQRAMIEGSDLHPQDRQLAANSTRERLDSGYRPADILNSSSRSIEMVWNSAVEAVDEGRCGPEVLAVLGRRLMPIHRNLIDVMTTTIREFDDRVRSDGRSALVADVASLFAGRPASSLEMLRALTPESEVQVVPIRLRGPEAALSRFEARHAYDGSLLAMCRSEGDLVALAFSSPARVEGVLMGEGPRTSLSGLVGACAQASRAVTIARQLGLEGVVSMDSLGARVAVVESPELGARLYANLVDKLGLDDGRGGALLRTVEVWMDLGMDVERAAEELTLHPNSVRYRLNRFASLTELSLHDVSDLVLIWWALEYDRSRSQGSHDTR